MCLKKKNAEGCRKRILLLNDKIYETNFKEFVDMFLFYLYLANVEQKFRTSNVCVSYFGLIFLYLTFFLLNLFRVFLFPHGVET